MIDPAFWRGMALGASLIMAIGAQNAFVLRQGILRRHVGIVVMVCAICDMALIAAGVAGMGGLIAAYPRFITIVTWGGAAFLFLYGLRAWRAAFRGAGALQADGSRAATQEMSWQRAIGLVLMLSLLNPHVYLDTVILLGGIGAREPSPGNVWFAGGAMIASILWFTALGYGARLLAPLFSRARAWQILDGVVGLMMWGLCAGLVAQQM
ncbi:LysE/ArgO family amino acid transporter [Pandoraea sputorum]|uniref:Amino acid transporter n=1 Tax=Pandoraea sputorum TaxID=93222 RepID=A0A239S854_9BURK|nr:LysE/ArgO family amino acid transporter [Pandoraea sputorum]AJC15868.1 amino acid transporter [Pandoraea sputorum]SNU81597.1 Arginine exporter protein ArgO [Pandoraea sputorum]VVD65418.1 amino acid transporter [Pandoraea sputorum]VVE75427.1 amino acid transporter [Pandoraea sputorum]BET12999.1 LysE/ArgO family amino acid transporter [Pandoraea sputorum]